MQKLVFWHMQRVKTRSDCSDALSVQGFYCLLTGSSDTTKYKNGEQMPKWFFAHVPDDLKPILRLFKGTFFFFLTLPISSMYLVPFIYINVCIWRNIIKFITLFYWILQANIIFISCTFLYVCMCLFVFLSCKLISWYWLILNVYLNP